MDLNVLLEELMIFLWNYGFIIVIIFGILHPIFDNPWSFFTMSLSITLLGIPIGIVVLLLSNIVGIVLVFFLLKRIDKHSNNYLYNKNISGKILKWLERTKTWRHVVVIGLPLVPTFFLKLAFPFTTISFRKYLITVFSAYLLLYSIYLLVYVGVLSFFTENISSYLGLILLLLFSVVIYYSGKIKENLIGTNEYSEN